MDSDRVDLRRFRSFGAGQMYGRIWHADDEARAVLHSGTSDIFAISLRAIRPDGTTAD